MVTVETSAAVASDPVLSASYDSDASLLDRYVRLRDADAFRTLVRRFGPMVRGVAMRTVSHREDAEDVTQVVFTELARRAGTVEDPAALGGWLHTVTVRTSLRLRKKRRRSEELNEQTASSDGRDPLAAISQRADLATLSEELDELPEGWREPLVLRYFAGCDTATAAARMGLSEEAFKGRIKRGKNTLRVRLLRRGVGVTGVLAAALSSVESAAAELPVAEVDALWSATADAALELSGEPDITPLLAPETQAMPTAVLSLKAVLAACVVAMLSLSGGGPEGNPVSERSFAPIQTAAADPPDAGVITNIAPVTDSGADSKLPHIEVYETFDLPSDLVRSIMNRLKNDGAAAKQTDSGAWAVRATQQQHRALEEQLEQQRVKIAEGGTAADARAYDIEPWMLPGLVKWLVNWKLGDEGRSFEVNDDGTQLTVQGSTQGATGGLGSTSGDQLKQQINMLREGERLSQEIVTASEEAERTREKYGPNHPKARVAQMVSNERTERLRRLAAYQSYIRSKSQSSVYDAAELVRTGASDEVAPDERRSSTAGGGLRESRTAPPSQRTRPVHEPELNRALSQTASFEFVDTPLSEVADYLNQLINLPVTIDLRALEDEGITPDEPVTFYLNDVPARTILVEVLTQEIGDLDYYARDGVLHITTQTAAAEHRYTMAYPIPEGMESVDVAEMIESHNLTSPRGDIMFEAMGGNGVATPVGKTIVITHSDRGHEAVQKFLDAISGVSGTIEQPPMGSDMGFGGGLGGGAAGSFGNGGPGMGGGGMGGGGMGGGGGMF